MKRIAVIMTIHNRREKTLRCLACLYSCLLPKGYFFDVFMTDDGCTDGTAEAVRNAYPEVVIFQGDGNLYWNRGMWTAWNEAAKGNYDFYLWLNDDTYMYPMSLEKLIAGSILHDDKSIIVGATENSEKTAITYGGYLGGKRQIPRGEAIEVEYFNGNVVLIPRYVYEKLGNLDYYFRHSKGDFDYGMRAQKAGIKMYQLGRFSGICDSHYELSRWCNPDAPFLKRWQSMMKPNGMPPNEVFYLNYKHSGVFSGIVHSCSAILRCFFPKLYV